jgi:anti-sigma factor (TIGR02949 family)
MDQNVMVRLISANCHNKAHGIVLSTPEPLVFSRTKDPLGKAGRGGPSMNPCDDYAVKIMRYLDDDLREDELCKLRIHIRCCAKCRAHLTAERALSNLLVRARPLYSAPAALRARVASMIRRTQPESVVIPSQRAARLARNCEPEKLSARASGKRGSP